MISESALLTQALVAAQMDGYDALNAIFDPVPVPIVGRVASKALDALKAHAEATGDWGPWAKLQWFARMPEINLGAATLRAGMGKK